MLSQSQSKELSLENLTVSIAPKSLGEGFVGQESIDSFFPQQFHEPHRFDYAAGTAVGSDGSAGEMPPADLQDTVRGVGLIAPAAGTTLSLAERILAASRTGSGLKPDPTHRAASFLTKAQLEAGPSFMLPGGDGVVREFLQAPGGMGSTTGIFEYILDPKQGVTHQRFIPGGQVTGVPNQKVP